MNTKRRAEMFRAIERHFKRGHLAWACGKRMHTSKKEAKKAADFLEHDTRNHREGYKINVYRCNQCSGWHVGHTAISRQEMQSG